MMKNSPYLDQDRELDLLLKLVRDYDAKTRQFKKLPEVTGAAALLSKSAAEASANNINVGAARSGKSPMKRAS